MTEQEIKDVFIGKTIDGIELYAGDGKYIEVKTSTVWIVHAGVQFKLGEQTFTFGWHETEELTTFFEQKIMEMSSSFSVSPMGAQELDEFKSMMASPIKDLEVIGFEATYDDGTSTYLVESLIFHFENGQRLQIAGVDFSQEEDQIAKITYNYQGGTLVSLETVDVQYKE